MSAVRDRHLGVFPLGRRKPTHKTSQESRQHRLSLYATHNFQPNGEWDRDTMKDSAKIPGHELSLSRPTSAGYIIPDLELVKRESFGVHETRIDSRRSHPGVTPAASQRETTGTRVMKESDTSTMFKETNRLIVPASTF